MNKFAVRAGMLSVCVLCAGCGISDADTGENILRLPECSGKGTAFASLQLDAARSNYHTTVAGVVDAHLSELADINTLPLQCTANDYRGLLQPSTALSALAAQLPEWGASRAGRLSEADIGPVLLEYLRVYECALYERERFLVPTVQDEKEKVETDEDGNETRTIDRTELVNEKDRQQKILTEELLTARPALERTIAFLGVIDRLRPLSAELECLKRASLDVRNVTGLTAEAASCMPKMWDARGSLRDLSE